MTEQCMHDGKAGPCERQAVEAEHFCRRHLPKKAGPTKRGPLVVSMKMHEHGSEAVHAEVLRRFLEEGGP